MERAPHLTARIAPPNPTVSTPGVRVLGPMTQRLDPRACQAWYGTCSEDDVLHVEVHSERASSLRVRILDPELRGLAQMQLVDGDEAIHVVVEFPGVHYVEVRNLGTDTVPYSFALRWERRPAIPAPIRLRMPSPLLGTLRRALSLF